MSRAQPLSTTLSLIPVLAASFSPNHRTFRTYVRTYVRVRYFPQPKKRKTLLLVVVKRKRRTEKERERERERIDVGE